MTIRTPPGHCLGNGAEGIRTSLLSSLFDFQGGFHGIPGRAVHAQRMRHRTLSGERSRAAIGVDHSVVFRESTGDAVLPQSGGEAGEGQHRWAVLAVDGEGALRSRRRPRGGLFDLAGLA